MRQDELRKVSMWVDERHRHPSFVERKEETGQEVRLARPGLTEDVHVGCCLLRRDAKRTAKEPQEAAKTQRNSWAAVLPDHVVWKTTPPSINDCRSSSSETASPVSP